MVTPDASSCSTCGGSGAERSSAFRGRPFSAVSIDAFQICAGKVAPVTPRVGELSSLPTQTAVT